MKKCFKCSEVKPLTEFYAHPQMADGHLNKCKCCTRKDVEARRIKLSNDPIWSQKEAERHRFKSRRYIADGRARPRSTRYRGEVVRRYRIKHPDAVRAHQAVRRAIRRGLLIRLPCEKCGAYPSQAHHDDYSKPLVVQWFCPHHHAEADIKRRSRNKWGSSSLV